MLQTACLLPRTLLLAFLGTLPVGIAVGDDSRLEELDRLWTEVSRSVTAGDFEGYAATCHPKGVLVSGSRNTSYPLSRALAGWEQGFIDTREGRMKASVTFRFSRRIGGPETAHETGIFRYVAEKPGAAAETSLIHFEALLVKEEGSWQILMEFQKKPATEAEWRALAPAGEGDRE